jgi:hypothetical protein
MQRTNSWRQILAWATLVISSASFVLVLYISLVLCLPSGDSELAGVFGSIPAALAFVGFAVLCILIVTFRPENRIGWLCGVISIGGAIVIPIGTYQNSSCVPTSGPVSPELAIGISVSSFLFLLVVLPAMFTLLPLWFPNGKFLSPPWRAFWYVASGLVLGAALVYLFSPGALGQYTGRPIVSPLELDVALPAWIVSAQQYVFAILLVLPLIANASLVVRYRRADAVIRQQLKVFGVLAVGGVTLLLLVELLKASRVLDSISGQAWVSWAYLVVLIVGWLGYPTAIGVAILRYRLYDIEVIIRRTLVYSILTGLLAVIYFGSVVLVQQLTRSLTGTSSDVAIVVSTLVIAALFFPLRRRVQNAIDRRFYRRKYDAAKTLAAFGVTVRAEVELEKLTAELINVVNETMQPASVSVWLRDFNATSPSRNEAEG